MPSARPVPIPAEKYPFPFRTRKSSPPGPMVLTPNPASGEQVGAGLAEGITWEALVFEGRADALPGQGRRGRGGAFPVLRSGHIHRSIIMRITRQDKRDMAEALGRELSGRASFFAGFAGMTFADADALRRSLRPAGARFRVARNAIVSHALDAAGLRAGDPAIAKGPTAVVVLEDAEEIARVARELRTFAKARPCVRWKGGFADGQWIGPDGMETLAEAGGRRELAGRLAGGLYSAYARLRYALDAIIEKQGGLPDKA